MIDSRDFLNAKKLAETQLLLASGHRGTFAGGVDCNDHQRLWDALDKVHAKHGPSPWRWREERRMDRACPADNPKVPHVAVNRTGAGTNHVAPFKRIDVLLESAPVGVVLLPGSGIVERLADKA